jgi:hypothetical protein
MFILVMVKKLLLEHLFEYTNCNGVVKSEMSVLEFVTLQPINISQKPFLLKFLFFYIRQQNIFYVCCRLCGKKYFILLSDILMGLVF